MQHRERAKRADENLENGLGLIPGLYQLLSSRLKVFAEGIRPKILAFLTKGDLILSCGLGNTPLAQEIAQHYQEMYGLRGELCETMKPKNPKDRTIFPDNELRPTFGAVESKTGLRNKVVFIIQSFTPIRISEDGQYDETTGINDRIMELWLMIDAAKLAGAKEIHVVLPYAPYMRSDRKDAPKSPIAAALFMKILEFVGATSITVLDVHNEQVAQGSVNIPVNTIYASYVLVPEIKARFQDLSNTYFLCPDAGAMKRTLKYARMVFGEKEGKSRVVDLLKDREPGSGELTSLPSATSGIIPGSNIIMIDDMAATCGTMILQAEEAKEQGAGTITVVVTHGLLVGGALEKLEACDAIDKLVITDSIEQPEAVLNSKKIKIVPVARYLAEVIHCVYTGEEQGKFFL